MSASERPPLPPASFDLLVGILATNALVALGQIPLEKGKPAKFLPEEAKHCVDLLAVLEEKTRGNLTATESRALTQALHELRMAYLQKKGTAGDTGASS